MVDLYDKFAAEARLAGFSYDDEILFAKIREDENGIKIFMYDDALGLFQQLHTFSSIGLAQVFELGFYLYGIPEWFLETLSMYSEITELLIWFNLHQRTSFLKRRKPTLPILLPPLERLTKLTLDTMLIEDQFDLSNLPNLETFHLGFVSGERWHNHPITFPQLAHPHIKHLIIDYYGQINLSTLLLDQLPNLKTIELLAYEIAPSTIIKDFEGLGIEVIL